MESKTGFKCGSFGPWIPIIVMIAGMLVSTAIGGGGLGRLTMVAFFALAVGFFIAEDKKNFGRVTVKGLTNPMFGTIVLAYVFAGLLAQLMRQSGLINALIWAVSEMGVNAGIIPLVSFLTCVLISTSCGTSTGSVAAVAPVLVPLAHSLGVDVGLVCGAIISGAIFGDNLAPISDTTISSALTQEAEISDVVRTRFPYAAVSAVIAAALFTKIGLDMSSAAPAAVNVSADSARALVLLILPVAMVVMMRCGWDLMSTLIVCNIAGIVINLLLGTIPPEKMFDNKGPIVAGMNGMMGLVLYVMLLFMVLEILNSSGALERMGSALVRYCRTSRSGEFVIFLAASIGSAVTGGSGIAIIFFGPLVRRITKLFNIDRCRGANILDGVACAATGLLPYGNPMLVSLGVVMTLEGIEPNFSFLNVIPYEFHCWGLLIIFLLSIITGIGRKAERAENQ